MHEHEEFKCLHPGCDVPSLFLCAEHAGEFVGRVEEYGKGFPTDLRTAAKAAVDGWEELWKGGPVKEALEKFAGTMFDLALAVKGSSTEG